MKIPEHLTLSELQHLLHAVDESLGVSSHLELFNWLQQGVRPFIPHDIVIAAWGDFSLGLVRYDLVSALPGLRTDDLDEGVLHPFVSDLFVRWQRSSLTPYAVVSSHGFNTHYRSHHELIEKLRVMPSALVHGIKDQRGRHDCLYIFLGPSELGLDRPRTLLRYLLPYVDAAFRQVAHLPEQYLPPVGGAATLDLHETALPMPDPDDTDEFSLSAREHDIMEWVRAGKTNQEIGMILDISAFTVKNHIQRIFKKLNVVNRAQAVSKMGATKNSGKR
jgi:transcriptional regulator EpsA